MDIRLSSFESRFVIQAQDSTRQEIEVGPTLLKYYSTVEKLLFHGNISHGHYSLWSIRIVKGMLQSFLRLFHFPIGVSYMNSTTLSLGSEFHSNKGFPFHPPSQE